MIMGCYDPQVADSGADATKGRTMTAVTETAQGPNRSETMAPCTMASWTPEVHDLYGDADSIMAKLDSADMDLSSRRIFVLLSESEDRADVRLFEHVEDGHYAVLEWKGGSLDGTNGRLAQLILENKGLHCVGEQAKALLAELPLELRATVPAPATSAAAIEPAIRDYGPGTFMRVTTALLC